MVRRLPHSLAVLANLQLRRLFIGQAASLLGDGMVAVALSFAVLDAGGSAADLGYVLGARSIALVAMLLVGGVIADRLPRRKIMVTADLARLASQACAASLIITHHAQIWELAVLQVLHGLASGAFDPASAGLIPAIAPSDQLQQANGLRGLAFSVGNIVGPSLAGILVATVGPDGPLPPTRPPSG